MKTATPTRTRSTARSPAHRAEGSRPFFAEVQRRPVFESENDRFDGVDEIAQRVPNGEIAPVEVGETGRRALSFGSSENRAVPFFRVADRGQSQNQESNLTSEDPEQETERGDTIESDTDPVGAERGSNTSEGQVSGPADSTARTGIEETAPAEEKERGLKVEKSIDERQAAPGAENPPPEAGEGEAGGKVSKIFAPSRPTNPAVGVPQTGKASNQSSSDEAVTRDTSVTDSAGGGIRRAVPSLDTSGTSVLIQSLGRMPVSDFALRMSDTREALAERQEQERTELADRLPEIPQPTGLPPSRGRASGQAKTTRSSEERSPGTPPDLAEGARTSGDSLQVRHEVGRGPAPGDQPQPEFSEPDESSRSERDPEQGSWLERLLGRVSTFVRQLPSRDPAVNASAGRRPNVSLTGKASPGLIEENRQRSRRRVAQKRAQADAATQEDFGEHDIYPEVEPETLRPDVSITGGPTVDSTGRRAQPDRIDPQVRASLDETLQSHMDAEVEPRVVEHEQDRQTYEADTEAKREEGLADIEAENQRVRVEQEAEQDAARAEVNAARQDWKAENRQIRGEYEEASQAKKEEYDRRIHAEVQAAEERADEKMTQAEAKAEAERRAAEAEARKKKAELQQKPKSFWGRLRGAIKSALNSLRKAVNAVFDAMRSAVKIILEQAKRLVKGIIEAARRLVVGLIRSFSEVLKGLVTVALAAFPKTAAKWRATIDEAVDGAVQRVNRAAEALKAFADATLDALGTALDTLLAAYQWAVNAVIDALEFVAVGIIQILEGLSNLVAAARQMPDHFMDALFEALTGSDPSQPLPLIERTEPSGSSENPSPEPDRSELTTTVGSVPDIVLDPELEARLALIEDGEIEIEGSSDNPVTLNELGGTTYDTAGGPGSGEGGTESSGLSSKTDDEKLDYYIEEMDPSCDAVSKGGSAEGSEFIPDAAKVGPLTKGQRRSYILRQLKKGISNWWECNKVTVILSLIGILVGGAVLTILTGGAILAAIPPIMKALAVFFLADLLVQISGHVKDYLTKAWSGDIEGGAKSLAKALAVGAVELIFTGLFKVGGRLLKIVRAAGKRLARSAGKVARRAAKALQRSGPTGRRLVRGGKSVVRSGRSTASTLKRGFAQGSKTLDDFGRRLRERFRFRRFKIRVGGRRFRIFGLINPWVLFASGKLEFKEQEDLKSVAGSKTARLGNLVKIGRKQGVVVGVRRDKSKAVQEIGPLSGSAKTQRFRGLKRLGDDAKADAARRAKLGTPRSSLAEDTKEYGEVRAEVLHNTHKLADALGTTDKPNVEAHHLIPVELVKRQNEVGKFIEEAIRKGFAFNGKINGRALERYSSKVRTNAGPKGRHASHPNYTKQIEAKITSYIGQNSNYSPAQAKNFLEELSQKIDTKIDSTSVKINKIDLDNI
jgi:hypothetical protein